MSAAQQTFISSTYWTDRIGPSAALAMIQKHRRESVGEHLIRIGTRVQTGWKTAAEESGLSIKVYGLPPLSGFSFCTEHPEIPATLLTQEFLERGYLASTQFYSTWAHSEQMVDRYLENVRAVFGLIARALAEGSCEKLLKGPVKHTGFKRLN